MYSGTLYILPSFKVHMGDFMHMHILLEDLTCVYMVGRVSSIFVRSTLDQVVWVEALAGDIVLCSLARHYTCTVPLSTQVYIKWVLMN